MRMEIWRAALVVAVGVMLVAGAAGCGGESEESAGGQAAAPPPEVKVVVVEPVNVPTVVEYTAKTEAAETVDVRARVAGILEKRHFKEGSNVAEGDLLFTIDPAGYSQNLDQERAVLEQKKALLDNARTEYDRFKKLYDQGVVSREEYDAKLTAMKELEAEVKGREAAVGSAKLNVDYTRVTAPITGLIGRAQVEQGSLVGQGEPTLLATITSIDPMYVDFSISERDYLRYMHNKAAERTGQMEILLILADDFVYPHQGELDMVDPTVNPDTGGMGVRTSFPNPDGLLKPGLFGRVRFISHGAAPKLLIPRRAVMEIQGVTQAYVADDAGKVSAVTLTLGDEKGNLVEVKEGVQAGAKVLVDGLMSVQPSMVINPQPVPLDTPAVSHEANGTAQ